MGTIRSETKQKLHEQQTKEVVAISKRVNTNICRHKEDISPKKLSEPAFKTVF